MNRFFLSWVWLAFLPALAAAQSFDLANLAEVAPLRAVLVAEVSAAKPGEPFRAAVRLEHAPEWHTYGKVLPPDVIGKPTSLKWTLPEGWTVEELPWPATHEVPSTDGKTSTGYDGTVYLPVRLTPAGAAGSSAELKVKVDALACDPKNCMPQRPEAALTLALADQAVANAELAADFAKMPALDARVEAPGAAGAVTPLALPAHSFGMYLVIAFLGGLILNVMPCVFPVLGIKIMSVVKQAGEDKRAVMLHGMAYTWGILVCFWLLGGLVVTLGKTWGFQLQSPGFVFGLTIFFLVFALNMAGVFEIGASAVGVGADLQAKQGLAGSFFSGLLAVVVATPCSAPFLGSALGFAVTLPTVKALVMFSMIGLGLASPFLVLSLMPKLVSALPRPGAWMESFKQGMSFLLFGTVAYMIWVLMGKDLQQLFALFGLVLIAMGCWIYGRWCLPHLEPRTRKTGGALALAVVVAGIWTGWPKPDQEWQAWSPEKVAELHAKGVPVYVDYTAKWCFTCQVNKRVYGSAAVQKKIAEKKIAMLKADWTNEDPRITEALTRLGKAAVPVNVLYIPGRKEPRVLDELDGLLTEDLVLKAFGELP